MVTTVKKSIPERIKEARDKELARYKPNRDVWRNTEKQQRKAKQDFISNGLSPMVRLTKLVEFSECHDGFYQVEFTKRIYADYADEITEWLSNVIEGDYMMGGNGVYFANEEDQALFVLMWGDTK